MAAQPSCTPTMLATCTSYITVTRLAAAVISSEPATSSSHPRSSMAKFMSEQLPAWEYLGCCHNLGSEQHPAICCLPNAPRSEVLNGWPCINPKLRTQERYSPACKAEPRGDGISTSRRSTYRAPA